MCRSQPKNQIASALGAAGLPSLPSGRAALAAIVVVANVAKEKTAQIDIFSGLFWNRPIQAATLTIAMLSFAGIPLTAGFMGKRVFTATGLVWETAI